MRKGRKKAAAKFVVSRIRRVEPGDYAAIAVIQQQCGTRQDTSKALSQLHCHGLVATLDEVVTGFSLQRFESSHIQLLQFGVAEGYRRQGIGTQLVDQLLGLMGPKNWHWLLADVPITNSIMLMFLRRLGFTDMRRIAFQFATQDGAEDAIVMRCGYKVNARPGQAGSDR